MSLEFICVSVCLVRTAITDVDLKAYNCQHAESAGESETVGGNNRTLVSEINSHISIHPIFYQLSYI